MFDEIDPTLPSSMNWFTQGAVTAPLNQGMCGSCWAFTTAATLESLAVISGQFTEIPKFSIQQLVDCDTTNSGCDGGWMFKAYKYASKYGVMTSESYPYKGRVGECMYEQSDSLFKSVGMVQEIEASNEKLKKMVSK